MLAAAMKSSFQEAVSGAVVQAVAAMPKPTFPPQHPDEKASGSVKPDESGTGEPLKGSGAYPDLPANMLSVGQLRLLSAELGHIVKFENASQEEIISACEGKWSNRDLGKHIQRLLRTYAGDQVVPKTKRGKLELLFKVAKKF